MKTLFDPQVCASVIERFDRLAPEQQSLWGRMTAPQMVCHVADQLRNALGELDVRPMRTPLAYPPVNWLLIHWVPWPKGRAKSPPEFLARRPVTWDEDLAALRSLIRRFSERGPHASWPESPVFGRISGKSWGVLAFKHLDHHLRQFSV